VGRKLNGKRARHWEGVFGSIYCPICVVTPSIRRLKEKRIMANPSLSALRKEKPFASWEGFVDPPIIEKSRKVYEDTIDSLLGLADDAPAEARLAILERYVERFNELDEAHDHFIATIEREDICECFGQIADIVGLDGIRECDDLPNVERDW